NPSLTTRLNQGGKNPVRVILDTDLRIPLTSKVIADKEAETWIITGSNRDSNKKADLERLGIKVIEVSGKDIRIQELLTILGENEITSLLVEGGGTVN
ncbi:dihydrofolate reductase family protein, partial [Pseudomonas sp. 2822-17]|uniref:RibD family protein n=1 Tax=Pseudomonas sp. 2822-17 TaxID=1712678 RepID=UPI0015B082D6